MFDWMSTSRVMFGWLIAATLAASPAAGQPADRFYKGKVVTITVGISAGGGYDQYARLLARHLPKHIPGEPTIVVRNLPGAGSLTAVLQLDSVLPADGTQIVAFNAGLLNDSMADGDRARVKFDRFSWLGSMAKDLRVCFTWKTSGVKTWEDLQTRKDTVFGAPGANSNAANGISIIRNLFNLSLRTISGYPGNTEMLLAVERGEVDGTCISWTSIPENWVSNRDVNVLVRLSPDTAPEIPSGVKFVGDLMDTPEKRSIVDVLVSSGELARPFILSRIVPADRLEVLRSAFAAALADKEFLADASKQRLLIEPVAGADAEAIAKRLYNLPEGLSEKARAIIKNQ
jgi:tripartite-type tricarboxylate transporter receptor subunit TctC